MRHAILILMIALMPIRIWAFDMMAVSMAAQQLLVAQTMQWTQIVQSGMDGQTSFTQSVAQAQTPMSADCPMMFLLAGKQAGDSKGKVGSTVFKVCTTCQLCMGLVTGYAPRGPLLMPLPPTALWLGSTPFTSAERAPGFKPPIS